MIEINTIDEKMLTSMSANELRLLKQNVLDIKSANSLKEKAIKVSMNSLYGAIGNEHCKYFSTKNAEAITLTGQFIIQYIANGINRYLNKILKSSNVKYVKYIDTDSNYVCLSPLVKKFANDKSIEQKVNFVNSVCEKCILPLISKFFAELSTQLNGRDDVLGIKREIIADKVIWTAKKRYIMNVRDEEGKRKFGLKKDKNVDLKFKGVEIAKSTIPKFCRDAMKQAITIVMEGDQEELYTFMASTKVQFMAQSPEDVAFPRSVNGLKKYGDEVSIYTKGTPIHTKGALIYNHLIRQHNLENKYPVIRDGEKIRYIHMREPNPITNGAMAFPIKLPAEFNLDTYIDWELQWTKSMEEPLMLILRVIDWDTQKRACLDDLFEPEIDLSNVTWADIADEDEQEFEVEEGFCEV